MTTTTEPAFITPPELARRLGISENKVYAWIDSKQLRAVDLSENPDSERARWRISEAAIAEFLEGRSNALPPPEAKPTRRRRRAVAQEKEWF